MFGSGEILYHLTFIDDLVRGIIACGENPKAAGQIYITATTLNELNEHRSSAGRAASKIKLPFWTLWSASILCEFACKPLGIKPPLSRRRADFFRKDRSFDTAKIRTEVGFKPEVGLEEGIRRTGEWYRAEGLL